MSLATDLPELTPALSRRGFLRHCAAAGAAGSLAPEVAAQGGPAPAAVARLKVLSAGSALYGMRPCAEDFSRSTAIVVEVATDHGHNIRDAALHGTLDADVVALPTAMVAALVTAGRADAASAVAIGAVRIGAAVREGMPLPDVSTVEALRHALTAAPAVFLTLAPTGDHLMGVIARLGLADQVAPKLQRFDTATLLNRRLAEASRAIGFGPATEIRAWRGKGVAWAGAIPDEIQIVLPYQVAALTPSRAGEPARVLLEFLATEQARRHFIASGVE
jgi:molybdate transport system substrate-binding protein